MDNHHGKLIVLDGIDGSGKTTQTEMLADRLRLNGYEAETADFPQYGKKSAGLVEEYLNGRYGTAEDIGPYRASIFYAADRYDASFKIRQWLKQGKIVISNRYVSANMGHQGGKINDEHERKKFFSWLDELEYDIFKIPKPDLNIILHLDAEIAQKLVGDKTYNREYLNGAKRDIHESELSHLQHAEETFLEIAKTFPTFISIECSPRGRILSRKKINDLIWAEIMKLPI